MIVVCVLTLERLNKFGHLPTAFIELFSTVLVELHGGGAPSEGLQPKDLSFEQIPFETGCPIMDHSRPFGRAASSWDLPSTQYDSFKARLSPSSWPDPK
jgi:hypothetical protein